MGMRERNPGRKGCPSLTENQTPVSNAAVEAILRRPGDDMQYQDKEQSTGRPVNLLPHYMSVLSTEFIQSCYAVTLETRCVTVLALRLTVRNE